MEEMLDKELELIIAQEEAKFLLENPEYIHTYFTDEQ